MTVLVGYPPGYTKDCERVLLTLISGLGPYRESPCLVGGLTPRYLVKRRPPDVAEHAGTGDVDIVVDLSVITETDAYKMLEQNLERLGFERARNEEGAAQSWRWQTITEHGAIMVVEFLADDPNHPEIRARPLPTQKRISALNIPKASMVLDMYETHLLEGELLNGGGKIAQEIRHTNIVAHTCLKMFAYADRREGKDAHDLVYVLENSEEGLDKIAERFRAALTGKHADAVQDALTKLRGRLASDDKVAGEEKDGPIAVSNFEIEGDEDNVRERRILRRREAVTVVEALLKKIG